MTTPARDPRTDPRPGDVVSHPSGDPHVTVFAVQDESVNYKIRGVFTLAPLWKPLAAWREWVAGWEVIHRAED